MSVGPRGPARSALLFVALTIGRTVAAAPTGEDPPSGEAPGPTDTASAQAIDRVEVSLVGGAPPCSPSLRDVVSEQLADLTPDLVLVCREHIYPEAVFRSDGA